jgi:hypothetical protein
MKTLKNIQLTNLSVEEQIQIIKHSYVNRGLTPFLFKTTVGQFLDIIKQPPYSYNIDFHTTHALNASVFSQGYAPRKYYYDIDYIERTGTSVEHYCNDDKRKFFEATKIFYFLKNPITEFRTPFFLVNTPFTNNSNNIHGLFRTMMLPFFSTDIDMSLIVCDHSIIEWSKDQFNGYVDMLSLNTYELADILKLQTFNNSEIHVLESDEIGVQIIEPHSTMSEFKTEWEVEFDGIQLIVNGIAVAKQVGEQFLIISSKNC